MEATTTEQLGDGARDPATSRTAASVVVDDEHGSWFWPSEARLSGPTLTGPTLTGPTLTGPTLCVDIDGVLADATHRQHLLKSRWRDWDGFFEAAGGDGLLAQQAVLLETVADDHVIALVTARPAWIADITIDWLVEHDVRWDLLVMRSNSDFGASAKMKTAAVRNLRTRGLTPVLALDDDARNVAAYAKLGVPCVYIHSGYHG